MPNYQIVPPTIFVSLEVWNKLQAYSGCKVKRGGTGTRSFVEVSGYLVAEQLTPDMFRISDALLMPSEGTAASTEMCNEGQAKVIQALMDATSEHEEGSIEANQARFALTHMFGWWHVHPGGGTPGWSGQDERQVEKFGNIGYDWFISIVLSHLSKNYRARIDYFNPYKLCIDNIELTIEEETNAWQEICQAEVDEKVKTPLAPTGVGFQGHGRVHRISPGQTKSGKGGKSTSFPVNDKRRVISTDDSEEKKDWREAIAEFRRKRREKDEKALDPKLVEEAKEELCQ
ncbi:MAG: hypothetical protein ACXABY_08725 [Candidatus Thorarchaeota archaeon]|jgi:hypothetical protein